jgi:hypothetical protein
VRPHRVLQFIFLGFLAALGAASSLAGQDDAIRGGMTKAERTYLLSELTSSKTALLGSIRGLTHAQWTFKPSPRCLVNSGMRGAFDLGRGSDF